MITEKEMKAMLITIAGIGAILGAVALLVIMFVLSHIRVEWVS